MLLNLIPSDCEVGQFVFASEFWAGCQCEHHPEIRMMEPVSPGRLCVDAMTLEGAPVRRFEPTLIAFGNTVVRCYRRVQ